MMKESGRILICGVGNILNGDDGVASRAIQDLRSEINNVNILLLDCGNEPKNFEKAVLEFEPDRVIIISALDFGRYPGTVDVLKKGRVRSFLSSGHRVKLDLFFNYLQGAIDDVIFIAVQPKTTGPGRHITPECVNAVPKVKEMVFEIIRGLA